MPATSPATAQPPAPNREPQAEWTVLQIEFAVPQIEFAVPQIEFAVPQIEFAVPQIEFAVPQIEFAAPQIEFAVPQIEFAVPQTEFAVPQDRGATSFTGTNSRLLPRRHRCWAPQPHSPAHARCPAGDSGVALTLATRTPRRCRAFRSLQLHRYGLAGC